MRYQAALRPDRVRNYALYLVHSFEKSYLKTYIQQSGKIKRAVRGLRSKKESPLPLRKHVLRDNRSQQEW